MNSCGHYLGLVLDVPGCLQLVDHGMVIVLCITVTISLVPHYGWMPTPQFMTPYPHTVYTLPLPFALAFTVALHITPLLPLPPVVPITLPIRFRFTFLRTHAFTHVRLPIYWTLDVLYPCRHLFVCGCYVTLLPLLHTTRLLPRVTIPFRTFPVGCRLVVTRWLHTDYLYCSITC